MVHLKKINPLLFVALTMIIYSCNNPVRDCEDFHTGNFYTETSANDIIYKSSFYRNGDGIQIEEFEGKIDSSYVRWVNDCEMILSPVNPKSMSEKKNILIKILTTTDSSYTYEYSFLGNSNKLKAKAFKIK